MFSESLLLTSSLEAHLLKAQLSQYSVLSYLQRLIVFPLRFLKMGVKEMTRSMSTWAYIAAAAIVAAHWITGGQIAGPEAGNLLLAVMLLPILLVIFALPSIYGNSGVEEGNVLFVTRHLSRRGFSSTKQVEFLRKSIKMVEDRTRNRVTTLKWLVGVLWAVFIYTLGKGIEHTPAIPAQAMRDALICAALLGAAFCSYFLVWGYEAALDKLFRAIEFGCNDFCHALESIEVAMPEPAH
jgi:hypothetical protein